ncbi:Pkinase-domain-containing protein [Aureobasidium pullulans]|uniref:Pkinase-domain-containing protein n=1 Tax=Aureobasidium pullulans TaxID=5580 RepID=A0AB74JCT4_AURPU|nr:Pkinase-domain-containing protein [Aureobasidium pullulans]THX48882.1 Pkinase-domain-containing protein [Aureobasidium pullulans]
MADSHNHPSAAPDAGSASEAGHHHHVLPSRGISLNIGSTNTSHGRPAAVKHMSLPAYQSPIRHHQRTPSRTTTVKETLNARTHYGSSDDDGAAVHRINQYTIKQEIGRGSFGAVHLAVDQFGNEYAVKEFSKSRLRKRAQSNLLRRPNQKRQASRGFNSPLHRMSTSDRLTPQANNSLDLIKEEIAIMKKLHHTNLVALIEVLDDPGEDSLYMVLEMCKKGVVMKVGIDDRADPYDEETCRCWFRDMILGIEYLHAQGIVHRDIKPDNCLVNEDDVLKIVDFGVSEMFEKESDMTTAKSAGSPAFMPPELCVAKHGHVSGRAADIWSMGVTLYCLRYGRIPFEKTGLLEMYESIRGDGFSLSEEQNPQFKDLMCKILEKDPDRRIKMEELRAHPWVTKNGEDPLLSMQENCADLVDMPTEEEMNHAITGNMKQLLVVMKAVKRFKKLLFRKRPELMDGLFGRASRIVAPPGSIETKHRKTRSSDADDRKPMERVLAAEGVHHDIVVSDDMVCSPGEMDESNSTHTETPDDVEHAQHADKDAQQESVDRALEEPHIKGHAHDPLSETTYLGIGTGSNSPSAYTSDEIQDDKPIEHIVCESPGADDSNFFEQAYQEEMQRIHSRRGREPTIYLTRRVENIKAIAEHESVIRDSSQAEPESAKSKWAGLASKIRGTDVGEAAQSGAEDGDDKDKE